MISSTSSFLLFRAWRPCWSLTVRHNRTMSSVSLQPTNYHISVLPDGSTAIDLKFVEEPLGLSVTEGYGWPQLDFNEAIGPDGQYTITRKLGWGMTSSTWLARDQQKDTFVAIKALNGNTTDLARQRLIWEHEVLKKVSTPPTTPHCLRLLSSFTMPGRGSAGEHLCFVTPLLGGDVNALPQLGTGKLKQAIPLPFAKRIILHVLRGISHVHGQGFVHTDLKQDNIFFETSMSTDEIDSLVKYDPPRRNVPEASKDGILQSAVSQPLPVPDLKDIARLNFVVADFGSAQPIKSGEQTQTRVAPICLRPPEVIIAGPWNEKVDIWIIGCLIFEFVMGHHLFTPTPYTTPEGVSLDPTEHLLYQMILLTREDFMPKQLAASARTPEFFDKTCNLRKDPVLLEWTLERSLSAVRILEPEDLVATADLMRRCLHLDPAERASAAELLSDPWFTGVG